MECWSDFWTVCLFELQEASVIILDVGRSMADHIGDAHEAVKTLISQKVEFLSFIFWIS